MTDHPIVQRLAERKNALNACYARALRRLRDLHDEEFREFLADEYKKAGVELSMRAGRLKKHSPTE